MKIFGLEVNLQMGSLVPVYGPREALWPTIVSGCSLFVYMAQSYRVGAARKKYAIDVPAVTGHPDFERVFRAHQNMAEQLIVFLPSLHFFSAYVSPKWGAILGGIWTVGRILYAVGYEYEAGKRAPGFFISLVSSHALFFGGLYGAAKLAFKKT